MNKTKVRVICDVLQEQAKKDDIGYIDGYVQGGDGRPYCVVVIKNFLSLIVAHQLEVIIEKEAK